MFFKGTPSEKKYSQDNIREIHNFFKIPIVKVLFRNLLSKKGMSYVTYPVRERVKWEYGTNDRKQTVRTECRGKTLTCGQKTAKKHSWGQRRKTRMLYTWAVQRTSTQTWVRTENKHSHEQGQRTNSNMWSKTDESSQLSKNKEYTRTCEQE
jgi:hypothetical protein